MTSIHFACVVCGSSYERERTVMDPHQWIRGEGWTQAQLQEATAMAELFKIEVHGPQAELDQLYEPLEGINPTYFVQST